MIAVLKPNATKEQRDHLITWLEKQSLDVHISEGKDYTVLGLVGDTSRIDVDLLQSLEIVSSVRIVSEPYKKCNRKFHPDDTVLDLGNGVKIGGGHFCLIAGPCSVESEEQIVGIARRVKAAGANVLRGGAFKPRTSPYDFQGLEAEGIKFMVEAKQETGLPIVSELTSTKHLDLFADVDIIQVGARNAQNFELLKALGKTDKPILLKRGIAGTLKELLMSAEYIMAGGNEKIILCERGIRSYETFTRNTLDVSAIPVLHELSHLPVIADPSHATGKVKLVPPMANAIAASGADGIMIEVHNDPMHAMCDGAQSLTPDQFDDVASQVLRIREVIGK